MHNIFIDADIFIDLIAKRDPHYNFSAKLFTLISQSKIKAFTSPIIISNIYYIISKIKSKDVALKNIIKLKSIVKILSIGDKIIDFALSSDFKDFEDAIQYYTAKTHNIPFLITRNKKDYKVKDISICTAEEYLSIWISSN